MASAPSFQLLPSKEMLLNQSVKGKLTGWGTRIGPHLTVEFVTARTSAFWKLPISTSLIIQEVAQDSETVPIEVTLEDAVNQAQQHLASGLQGAVCFEADIVLPAKTRSSKPAAAADGTERDEAVRTGTALYGARSLRTGAYYPVRIPSFITAPRCHTAHACWIKALTDCV